jgi:hypothetical protein
LAYKKLPLVWANYDKLASMFHQEKKYILQRVSIPDADLEQSFQHVLFRQYKKGDYIIHAGEYCRFVGFLNLMSRKKEQKQPL